MATHSGYFTQRHYLAFTDQSKGCLVHRLTPAPSTAATPVSLLRPQHPRLQPLLPAHLRRHREGQPAQPPPPVHRDDPHPAHDSRLRPRPPRRELPRNRGRQDPTISPARVGIPLTALPGRIYHGIKSAANTKRYFVDRFPIFLPAPGNPLSLPPVVTFTYCDTPGTSLLAYLTHLRTTNNCCAGCPISTSFTPLPSPINSTVPGPFSAQQFGDATLPQHPPAAPLFRAPPALGDPAHGRIDPCRPRLFARCDEAISGPKVRGGLPEMDGRKASPTMKFRAC